MDNKIKNALEYLKSEYGDKKHLTVPEFAELSGFNVQTIRNLISINELPGKVLKGTGKRNRAFSIPYILVAEWLVKENAARWEQRHC